LERWIKSGGKGALVAATGYGKSYVGINAINHFLKKNPGHHVLIVVPTDVLKQ